jgi:hypothetical protein
VRRLRFPLRALLLPAVVTVVACSSNDSGTLQIVTGEETDVFTASPAPTTLTVYAIDSSDNWTQLGTGPVSTSDIDLGNQDESNAATIAVLGTTSTGADPVAGFSLAVQYGALAGGTLPVFVQRTNEWARLPSPPTDARQSPTLAIISGEFLFIGGGSGSASVGEATQLYDFAPLSPVTGPPTLQVSPLSMPVIGTVGLVLGPDGANPEYYDFSDNSTANVPLPSTQFSFADVAGGQVIYDYDGSTGTLDYVFVVGGTRTAGAPTQAVLEINPNDTSNSLALSGNLTWLSLTTPRLGAAAAWVPGEGLVVVGGNAGGSGTAQPAGAELYTAGSSGANFTALAQFPSDPSIGAGATQWLDTQHVLVAGGITPTGQDAGVRVFNLVCMAGASDCITTWATLPIALTAASTYVLCNGCSEPALVVGNELESGLTHTYLLNSTSATELPTKVPHTNASSIQSPLGFGSVLLFGGADEIEQFMPSQAPATGS